LLPQAAGGESDARGALVQFTRASTGRNNAVCMNNLRLLDAAKEQAAVETGLTKDGNEIRWVKTTSVQSMGHFPTRAKSEIGKRSVRTTAWTRILNPRGRGFKTRSCGAFAGEDELLYLNEIGDIIVISSGDLLCCLYIQRS